jgi:c(7)-type cytochrome triheme protein
VNWTAVMAFAMIAAMQTAAHAGDWLPLARDGVHDPASPALNLLQEPREALSKLPVDSAGNQVRWVDALQNGTIAPRTNLFAQTKVNVLDLDILLNLHGGTPMVLFPHRQHTLWLDCSNCHDGLFKAKTGANKLSMLQILQGEQCGVCHGAVAFPLTECARCHNTPRASQAPGKTP